MGTAISWSKKFSSSDDDSILTGAQVGQIQTDLEGMFPTENEIILLPLGALVPSSNGAAQTQNTGTNFEFYSLNFDGTTDEYAYWQFVMPNFSSISTTCSVYFYWTVTDAAASVADEVEFEIDAGGFTNDEAHHAGALGGTAVGVTDALTSAVKDLMISTAATFTHGWVAKDLCQVKITRDVDGPSGTDLAEDACLLAVRIVFD